MDRLSAPLTERHEKYVYFASPLSQAVGRAGPSPCPGRGAPPPARWRVAWASSEVLAAPPSSAGLSGTRRFGYSRTGMRARSRRPKRARRIPLPEPARGGFVAAALGKPKLSRLDDRRDALRGALRLRSRSRAGHARDERAAVHVGEGATRDGGGWGRGPATKRTARGPRSPRRRARPGGRRMREAAAVRATLRAKEPFGAGAVGDDDAAADRESPSGRSRARYPEAGERGGAVAHARREAAVGRGGSRGVPASSAATGPTALRDARGLGPGRRERR